MEKFKKSWEFHGKTLTVENGEIAKQAGGSVIVRYNDTVILSTATANNQAKDTDFFPLTVLYNEKMYAAGKIPGGFLRREGRPTEHATLTARLIDRPIRPLFAEGFRNEVQVVNTVMSCDPDASSEMAALFGSSLALCVSDIPFNGPVAGVVVAKVGDEYIINPTVEEAEKAVLSLTVAGTKQAINMVEAGAKEVSEEEMLTALQVGHDAIKELCAIEDEVIAECAKEKMEVVLYEIDPSIKSYVDEHAADEIRKAVSIKGKLESYGRIEELKNQMVEEIGALEYEDEKACEKAKKQTAEYCVEVEAAEIRRLISEDKIRPDGRKLDELRPLDSQVDLLPRVHGSAMFTRGETQVISVTTLGPLSDAQLIEDLTTATEKRFMHQYNFPPFSVGEVGRMGTPGRREIGHGALGERALSQVLPTVEEFPYTIRTVAEVCESNGSSSQASICAGTMSLMAAGVPIKRMVAGVAMGLITVGDTYSILTDIQGAEDHYGDMDFKVAGTREGITALQMDIKVTGISMDILREALAQAHKGRMQILDNMETAISEPRAELSKWAPKFSTFTIPTDKIRIVIGKGGETIDKIIEECDGVKIDIDDNGKVVLYHTDKEVLEKTKQMIEDLIREAKVGEEFDAEVTEVRESFAFVKLFGNTDGLLHVSQLKWERVGDIKDELHVGDKVHVKVINIDDAGKIKVSIKECLPKPEGYVEPQKAPRSHKPERRNFRPQNDANVEKRVFKKKEETAE